MGVLRFIVIFFLFFPCYLLAENNVSEQVLVKNEVSQVVTVSELAPKALELNDDFQELTSKIEVNKKMLTTEQELLQDYQKNLATFESQQKELDSEQYINIERITTLIAQIDFERKNIDEKVVLFTETIKELSVKRTEWLKRKDDWNAWNVKFKANKQVVKPIYDEAIKIINLAVASIKEVELPLLENQAKFVKLQTSFNTKKKELEQIVYSYKTNMLNLSSLPIYSKIFWQSFDSNMLAEIMQSLSSLSIEKNLKAINLHYATVILLHCIVFLFLFFCLKYISKKEYAQKKLNVLLSLPITTALVLSSFIMSSYYSFDFPLLLKVSLFAIVTLSIARLIIRFIPLKEVRYPLNVVIVSYALVRLFAWIELPESFIRLVWGVFVAYTIYLLGRALFQSTDIKKLPVLIVLSSLTLGASAVVLLMQSLGYFQLAFAIYDSLVRIIICCFSVWLLANLGKEVLYIFCNYSFLNKVKFIANNTTYLVSRLTLFFQCFVVFWGVATLLYCCHVFNTVSEAAEVILNYNFSLGQFAVSVRQLICASLLFFVVISISWVVRQILNTDIYPKKHIQVGVRASFNRIIQYTFACIAVVLSLSALGVNLQNLAVAFGVLGVGIGFGLQNIVNNFASGVILLFERPIKVGDVVELGGERAVIKKLGLRATIIETYNKAEIIVPNSELASTKVINWTHTDRTIRTVIKLGVAYDSDMDKVVALLLDIAKSHPLVLKEPAPFVDFLSFGENALDVELRYWSTIENAAGIRNALNLEILKIFRENGVNIPFPQRQLLIDGLDNIIAQKK